MKAKTIIAIAALASLALSACGDGIQETGSPSIVLQDSNDRGYNIPERASASQQGSEVAVRIQNNGDAALTVESLEFTGPDVLVYDGGPVTENGSQINCTFDDESTPTNSEGSCTENQVCKQIPKVCHTTQLPETPFEIEAPTSEQFNFFLIADGTNEVDCPEPGDDVPAQFADNYCGKLRIETDAPTDNATFNDGDTTLYFQYNPSTSGEIEVDPAQLRYSDVRPGTTVERELTIRNIDSEDPLAINDFSIEGAAAEYMSYSPQNLPADLPSNSSQNWTFSITIPSDVAQEDIPKSGEIYIESSASNVNTAKAVLVDILGTGPVYTGDKKSLLFESGGPAQTLTVTNAGTDTLRLDSISFESASPGQTFEGENYEVVYQGDAENINDQGRITGEAGIAPNESATFDINYTGPANGGIGWMVIQHNDPVTSGKPPSDASQSGTSRLLLMGGRDEGFAQLVPTALNFEAFMANGDDEVLRPFTVRSLGAKPLNGALEWGGQAEPGDLSIQPFELTSTFTQNVGTLRSGDISYLGTNSEDAVIMQTVSFSGNIPVSADMNVTVNDGQSGTMAPEAQISPQFEGSSVEVGDVAQLTARDSMLNGDSENAIYEWWVLDRPMDGSFFTQRASGNALEFAVRPDAAGTWKIALIVSNGDRWDHAVYDLTVTQEGQ
jgi:hypothetical protein